MWACANRTPWRALFARAGKRASGPEERSVGGDTGANTGNIPSEFDPKASVDGHKLQNQLDNGTKRFQILILQS